VPNSYLVGNFSPVLDERSDDHELPVTGVIPPDLDGRLLRNGPNPLSTTADDTRDHWFSGDGMIHAISLADGRATGYRNRWVRTRRLAAALGTPLPAGSEEPIDGPANTHVVRHAGTTLALAESGLPHAVSDDLERARLFDFDGDLASPMCAHPKRDPDTGELVFFGYDIFGPPFLRYHVVDDEGRLAHTVEIDLPHAGMMHDFGVSTTRVAFLDLPVVFDLDRARAGWPVPFRWFPDAAARIGVMPRGDSGADLRWVPVEPCYVFHVLNCFDDGDELVLDVVRYDQAFENGPGEPVSSARPRLARWRVDPERGRVDERLIDDIDVEFPRIDDMVAGRPHQFGYLVAVGEQPEERGEPDFTGLVQYDLARDRSVRYEPGAGRSVSEPVFVRAADGRGEDEGWVLTVVYDAARDGSDLVILDGTSFAGPPVATVHLPTRVPFGLHGSWVPTGS
jgi:carotenoid cleavage dioxygenase-like enzyme